VAERLGKVVVLVAAGAVATGLALPVALGIGVLLVILILSLRQTVTAYPTPWFHEFPASRYAPRHPDLRS
jgi:hypothetical protein